MLYQRKGSRYVDAIEWTGENLKDIQIFMYPQSPLDHGNDQIGLNVYDPSVTYGAKTRLVFIPKGGWIGLNVYDPSATYGSKTRLVFIPKGGWIVRDEEGRLHSYAKREDFESVFEPTAKSLPGAALVDQQPTKNVELSPENVEL